MSFLKKCMSGDKLVIIIFVLLVLAFFYKAAFLYGAFFYHDIFIQNYPYKLYFMEQIKKGNFPLWTSLMYCGFPLFAEGQGNVLYPPAFLLFIILPVYVAYNYNIILHYLAALIFMYYFLKNLGIDRWGAFFGSVCFSFSGYMVTHLLHLNMLQGSIFLPLIFLIVDKFVRSGKLKYLIYICVVFAFLFLGSHPQVLLYNAMFFGIYLIYRSIEHFGIRNYKVISLIIILMCISIAFGMALSAAQLVPFFELVDQSSRGVPIKYKFLTDGSFLPQNLITLFVPNYYGTPVNDTYWLNIIIWYGRGMSQTWCLWSYRSFILNEP